MEMEAAARNRAGRRRMVCGLYSTDDEKAEVSHSSTKNIYTEHQRKHGKETLRKRCETWTAVYSWRKMEVAAQNRAEDGEEWSAAACVPAGAKRLRSSREFRRASASRARAPMTSFPGRPCAT